jgi:hypothetical protein
MSGDSYVELVGPLLEGRNAKVDADSRRRPMGTPSAQWNQERPHESAWLSLVGHDGEQIGEADILIGSLRTTG